MGLPGHCYGSGVSGTLSMLVWVAEHKSQRQLLNQWCSPHLQHGEPCGTWEGALLTAITKMALALIQKVNCKLRAEWWQPGSQPCHLLVAPCPLAVPSFSWECFDTSKSVSMGSMHTLPLRAQSQGALTRLLNFLVRVVPWAGSYRRPKTVLGSSGDTSGRCDLLGIRLEHMCFPRLITCLGKASEKNRTINFAVGGR